MAWHNETGKTGEKLAADWLEKKGFTILEKNWRHKRLEVDIIAEKDNLLHFIEVKADHPKIMDCLKNPFL